MVSANACSRAALLGIATGVRSITPLAAIGWAASSGRMALPGTFPFTLLARRRVSAILLLSAAGEFVADKLPFTPARTDRGPLLARILFGAVTGAVGFAAEEDSIGVGAAVGGLSAGWGAFAGLGVRTRLSDAGVPPFLAALAGDLLALGLAVAAVLQRGSRVR